MGATESHSQVSPVVEGEPLPAGDAVDVRDSATGDVLATVAVGDSGTVTTALTAAEAARPSLRSASAAERASWCERIAADIRDREVELADALVRETGVPIASTRAEVTAAAAGFERVADTVRSLTGKYRTWTTAEHEMDNSLVRAAPLGVVRCRSGGRAPLATAALQVAPALAAGNAVVMTPEPNAAVTLSMLAETVRSTVPTGGAGFVPTRRVADGNDRRTANVVLGSQAGGVSRCEQSLGGTKTTLVYPDADLDAAARAITEGGPDSVENRLAGAAGVLAHESIQDELVERIAGEVADWTAGDPFEQSSVVGVLPDGATARAVARHVEAARAGGASLVCGGEVEGRHCEPTVLAEVPREAALRREPIPGPVIPVTPFEAETTALRLATAAGPLGVARVFTDRHSLGMDAADTIDAGAVYIHGRGADTPAPVTESVGLSDGRARAAIRRLTRTKRVRTR